MECVCLSILSPRFLYLFYISCQFPSVFCWLCNENSSPISINCATRFPLSVLPLSISCVMSFPSNAPPFFINCVMHFPLLNTRPFSLALRFYVFFELCFLPIISGKRNKSKIKLIRFCFVFLCSEIDLLISHSVRLSANYQQLEEMFRYSLFCWLTLILLFFFHVKW